MRVAQAWLLLGMLIVASNVQAQSQQVSLAASARAFFKQGLRLADKGRTTEAADRFRRAMAIRYSPVIAFNLASMLEIENQLVEACELLYRVENDDEADQSLRESAHRLQSDIEPRIAHLTVTIDASVPDGTVKLDDMTLIPAQLGAPVPVDPTPHHIQLLRNSVIVEHHELALAPSADEFVHLGAPIVAAPQHVAAASQLASTATRRPAPARESRDGLVYSPWFWTGVGGVVVGVVILVAVLTLSGGSGGGQPVAAP